MENNISAKDTYYQTTARNLFLNQEFSYILDAFCKESISLILLKGIALIQGIYSDIGSRYIGDIDLLVKAEDTPKAIAILNELGYSNSRIYFNLKKPYSIYLNSLALGKPTKIPYFVHLHWHLLNTTFPLFMYKINMAEIWGQARIERYQDKDFLMMAPEHLIIYLSIHAFNHSFTKISLFCDIQRAIEFYKDKLNWQEVINIAKNWNAILPLYYSLYFTSKILNADLSWDFLSTLKPKKISKIEQRVISLILENKRGSHNLVYPLYLNMAGNTWEKIKFILLSLFPPPWQLAQIYSAHPQSFVFLYYFKRLGWAFAQVMGFLCRGRKRQKVTGRIK